MQCMDIFPVVSSFADPSWWFLKWGSCYSCRQIKVRLYKKVQGEGVQDLHGRETRTSTVREGRLRPQSSGPDARLDFGKDKMSKHSKLC